CLKHGLSSEIGIFSQMCLNLPPFKLLSMAGLSCIADSFSIFECTGGVCPENRCKLRHSVLEGGRVQHGFSFRHAAL
ncbi:MAG: hypothetical protein R6V38_13345, partial [Roseovarius gahaiensis]